MLKPSRALRGRFNCILTARTTELTTPGQRSEAGSSFPQVQSPLVSAEVTQGSGQHVPTFILAHSLPELVLFQCSPPLHPLQTGPTSTSGSHDLRPAVVPSGSLKGSASHGRSEADVQSEASIQNVQTQRRSTSFSTCRSSSVPPPLSLRPLARPWFVQAAERSVLPGAFV